MDIVLNQENEVFKLYDFKGGTSSTAIENLSQINIFVGANNTGKSLLLRELVKSFASPQFSVLSTDKEKRIKNYQDILFFDEIPHLKDGIENALKEFKVKLEKGTTDPGEMEKAIDSFKKDSLDNSSIFKLFKISDALLQKVYAFGYQKINPAKPDREKFIVTIENIFNQKTNYYSNYIPIIRTLRKTNRTLQNLTRNEYFPELGNFDIIFTGEDFYKKIKDLEQHTTENMFDKKAEFENFLSITFFNHRKVRLRAKLVPDNKSERNLSIKIGDEKEFSIYQLGDGIQAIIILTYQLFLNADKDLLLFIEEPELNLHPAFQRIFIETIKSFPKARVFFTTHSNHFLDMVLEDENDISIYAFQKNETVEKNEKKFTVTNVTNPNNNLLQQLGVRSSSVFLSNCTIWVEGITDRFYIRKYLKLYQEQKHVKRTYREDLHFSFVEYGGNNITHWSFLEDQHEGEDYKNIGVEYLCSKSFLIADNDGADEDDSKKKKKAERLKQLKKMLGDRFCGLKVREIENLLTPNVLIATLKLLNETKRIKVEDWSVFDNIKIENYQTEKIGNFIDNKIGFSSFASDSGSIKDKVKFAVAATKSMKTYDDLSKEAQDMGKTIYEFIEQMNHPNSAISEAKKKTSSIVKDLIEAINSGDAADEDLEELQKVLSTKSE